jgi:shikimate dehydrogenase
MLKALSCMRPDDTLTLANLAEWSQPGVHLAVLGHPVHHSLSPAMHNAALGVLAATNPRFAEWKYWKIDVPPENLAEALPRLHQLGFRGLNLTVPHKILALDLIAEINTEARAIGAVNTLVYQDNGYHGFNTDGYGMSAGISQDLGLSLPGTDIILLGAGGAARGAAVECIRLGCKSLWIGNRSRQSLDALIQQIQPICGSVRMQGFVLNDVPANLPAGALLINATSAGLRPDEPPPIDLERLPRPVGVFDMVYNPRHPPLLMAAARLGIPFANGLAMLVHQGARALSLWTGMPAPSAVMQTAAETALSSRP